MTMISRLALSLVITSFATSATHAMDATIADPISVLRSHADGHDDATVRVKTNSYNETDDPAKADVTTTTDVVKPPHIVSQGAPSEAEPEEAIAPMTDEASGLVYVTGGIGASEVQYLKALKGDYTFKLLLADKEGHLVDGVVVTIADAKGKKIAVLENIEPYLLVKLPAGRYKITASLNGIDVLRNVTIKKGKQVAVDARF